MILFDDPFGEEMSSEEYLKLPRKNREEDYAYFIERIRRRSLIPISDVIYNYQLSVAENIQNNSILIVHGIPKRFYETHENQQTTYIREQQRFYENTDPI